MLHLEILPIYLSCVGPEGSALEQPSGTLCTREAQYSGPHRTDFSSDSEAPTALD